MKTKETANTRDRKPAVATVGILKPAVATVGILSRRAPDEAGRPFGPPTGFFAECCQAAAKLGLRAVVFDATDVDPGQGTVKPATVVDGRWVECGREPFPAVIYDRAPVVDPAGSVAAERARDLFDRAGISFVNPLTFIRLAADKLETYRRLAGGGLPVPRTALLDEQSLRAFLFRYDHVYIKPRAGSQGTGVIEVVRYGDGRHVIRTLAATYEIRGARPARDRIMELAGQGAAGSPDCLVQQGIAAEPPGRRRFPRFDLRLLMQKNGRSKCILTGLAARVSQTGGPTSNLSNGARSEEAEPVLDALYGRSAREKVLRDAAEASFAAWGRMEAELGPIGEVGLDIVPDAGGTPWIIEVNARPGRNVFKRIADSADVSAPARRRFGALRRRAVSRPFEYAKTLTGTG